MPPSWQNTQLSPEKINLLASPKISLTYNILAANKIGSQSTSIGNGGKNELNKLALIIIGTMSKDLLMMNTSIAVSTISAIAKRRLNLAYGYWYN